MKKVIIFVILIIVLVLIGVMVSFGFGYNETDANVESILYEERESDFEIVKDNTHYEASLLNDGITTSPTGILLYEDNIFIVDSAENCIFVFDQEGNLTNQIGSTGNGEAQFLEPHQICAFENKFFVLDSGNNRIQVFDDNFEYLSAIPLNKFIDIDGGEVADFSYSDMAIDKDGNIYVSSLSISPKNAHVTKIDRQGHMHQLGNNLVGFLTSIHGETFFVNHKKIFTGKYNGKEHSFYISHENFLYKIVDNQLKKVGTLPFKYDPVSFTCDDTNIYMCSRQFDTLDKFDMEGRYISTLFEFNEDTKIRYVAYNKEQEYFIATAPENNRIYMVKKQDD